MSLKEDKATFTDNISFFPVIDLSRPSILHQGLTLKSSVVNVEPLEGVLFSNQFGAEADRNVAVFRNQTNYITLQGNKINCNATSDDSVVDLSLNPSGNVNISNDLTVSDISASGMNLSNNLSVSGETSFIIVLIILMQMLIFPIHRDSLFIKIQLMQVVFFQLKMHKDI